MRTANGTALWTTRVAGVLLIVLGSANMLLGLVSLASDLIRLPPPAAGGLMVAGAVTIAGGVLVLQGSRLALVLSLAVFGVFLFLQLISLSDSSSRISPVPSIAVLAAVVLILGVAVMARRGTAAGSGRGASKDG